MGPWQRAKSSLVKGDISEPGRSLAAGYLLLVLVLGPPVLVWLGLSIWGQASAFTVLLVAAGIGLAVVGVRQFVKGPSADRGSSHKWRVIGAVLGAVLSGIAILVQEYVLGGLGA